jgi:hypothetical protein
MLIDGYWSSTSACFYPSKLQAVRKKNRQGGGNRGATIKAPHVTSFEWWKLDPHDELVEEGAY